MYFRAAEIFLPRASAEGGVCTLEIVSQGRLNLLVHNVVSPLGDGTPFAQQQEISLLAPKTFLVRHPPHVYKLCFIMQCDLCPEARRHQTAFNVCPFSFCPPPSTTPLHHMLR